ncbi:YlcI/YnfO family protein [Nostoc sp. GT001]|uniref:YlcI/YnfO family protein n=1 Tax=Nostoc sp. GT001 TaxID=3056647 RepID=UPI0025AAF03C|nr:YlcI/YnfO family protein [Nostoc sp. GT001]MDM9585799.1 YlcI/YnfO family protein [Nostoc sp. GT001]
MNFNSSINIQTHPLIADKKSGSKPSRTILRAQYNKYYPYLVTLIAMEREALTICFPPDLLAKAKKLKEGSESFNDLIVKALEREIRYRQRWAADRTKAENLFVGGGKIGALLRSHDWSQTSLGAVETWSDSLKTAVQILLTELDRVQQLESDLLPECISTNASHQAAQADAFRVKLTNALRPLTDANEIQAIAAFVLGESLGASRVIYIEVLPDGKEVIVHKNYTNGVAELSGLYHLEDFGRNLTDDHRAGRTAIVSDVANYSKYTASQRAIYQTIDIAAHIDVPLIKNNQFVALLAVHQAEPRQWTEDEVKRVEETAEQTWAAVERARAEAALRESRSELERQLRKFDAIVAAIPDFIYTFDLAGRFTYISPALLNLWQKTSDEALGKNFFELDYPTDLATRHQQQIQQVIATRQPLKDKTPYTSAIGTRTYEYIFVPLLGINGAVDAVAGVTRDITDVSNELCLRKQVEQALRQSEEKSRNILESITDAFFALDENWMFTYVNQAAEMLLDRVAGDLIGKTLWEEYSGLIGNELEQIHWSAMRDRVAASMTAFYPDRDRWYEVRTYPAPNGITVYFKNVTEQIQTAATLRQSEERYRTLFESIDEGFCIIEVLFEENDLPSGSVPRASDYRFLEINPTFEQQTGLRQAVGKTARQLVPDLEDHWIQIYGQVALTGEPARFENGSLAMNRWFDVYACRMGEPEARKVAIVFKDISERKLSEELSRRTAEFNAFRVSLSDALRPLADPIEIQATASRVLGEYLSANRVAYFEVRGADYVVERDYVNGAAALAGNYPVDSFGPKLLAAYRTGRAVSASDVEADPNLSPPERAAYAAIEIGAYIGIPLIKRGEFVAGLAVHTSGPRAWTPDEVSLAEEVAERTWAAVERARAEAALRDSENRFRMAIESAQLGTWDWNLITNQLIWDEGCKAMHGLPPEAESSIEVFFAGLYPDDRERLEHLLQRTLNPKSNGKYDVEYRTIGIQDGVERWIAARGQAYFDAADNPQRFVGTVLNITEQKRIEAEREQLLVREQAARETADRANRIKDEFLAVLSHELRSPLNPILGWTQLLQNGKLRETQRAEALKIIERNANLQTRLIEDLLDISRIMQGKLSLTAAPVSLTFVIYAAVETVRLAAEAKNIAIALELDTEIAPIYGDAARLQQVMWNLLTNAVKFTPNNGQVAVELRQLDGLAQIQVIDTGKGINPQFLPHVFEYFRQEDGSTTRKFGGLGLGLAIVRQIVEMHGGRVTAESQGENQGATFIIQLPLMQHARAKLNAFEPIHTQTEAKVPLEGVQILLVDDEADTREFQALVLSQCGANVTAVASALEALQALEQFTPDVLVSDIGMAQMDGYMLMQQIRSRPANQGGTIRAIALTAYAAEIDQQRALQVGFQTHITKPVEPQKLVRAIVSLVS